MLLNNGEKDLMWIKKSAQSRNPFFFMSTMMFFGRHSILNFFGQLFDEFNILKTKVLFRPIPLFVVS